MGFLHNLVFGKQSKPEKSFYDKNISKQWDHLPRGYLEIASGSIYIHSYTVNATSSGDIITIEACPKKPSKKLKYKVLRLVKRILNVQ